MPNYRRAFIPGGCWFFTVNLWNRNSRLLTDNIDALRDALAQTRKRFPFTVSALVVLPDHLHTIWDLPDGDQDFPLRWRLIKGRFSKSIPAGEALSGSRAIRGERGIWQRRYWEHAIRDERDYQTHMNYCWINPVKHGLVEDMDDWPYSTFHESWGREGSHDVAGTEDLPTQFGERP